MKSVNNIVFLTPGFSSDENDTTAIPSLQLLFRNFKLLYPDLMINIVSFQYPFESKNYQWYGIPVFAAGGHNGKLNRLSTWFRILQILFQLRRSQKIDLVHAFWLTETSFIGLLFSRLTNTRFITTSMGQDVKKSNRYLRFLRLFRFEVFPISGFQKDHLSGFKNLKVREPIPFGVDPSYYNGIHPLRTIDILGVGSLNEIKNYPDFIEIIETVAMNFPTIQVRIIGEGIMRPEMEKMIRNKGLKKTITLMGELPYGMTIKTMQSAKILLHTSTFEGQALVITEALAAGLYVVTYPVGIATTLQSKKLMTGQTKSELIDRLLRILQNSVKEYQSEISITMAETCQNYFRIYQSQSEE